MLADIKSFDKRACSFGGCEASELLNCCRQWCSWALHLCMAPAGRHAARGEFNGSVRSASCSSACRPVDILTAHLRVLQIRLVQGDSEQYNHCGSGTACDDMNIPTEMLAYVGISAIDCAIASPLAEPTRMYTAILIFAFPQGPLRWGSRLRGQWGMPS
jgi:hypothetical protein